MTPKIRSQEAWERDVEARAAQRERAREEGSAEQWRNRFQLLSDLHVKALARRNRERTCSIVMICLLLVAAIWGWVR